MSITFSAPIAPAIAATVPPPLPSAIAPAITIPTAIATPVSSTVTIYSSAITIPTTIAVSAAVTTTVPIPITVSITIAVAVPISVPAAISIAIGVADSIAMALVISSAVRISYAVAIIRLDGSSIDAARILQLLKEIIIANGGLLLISAASLGTILDLVFNDAHRDGRHDAEVHIHAIVGRLLGRQRELQGLELGVGPRLIYADRGDREDDE